MVRAKAGLLMLALISMQSEAAGDLPVASCANATSNSVVVNWASIAGSDVYYVALTASPSPPLQPFTIQTSATTYAEVIDLLPNKEFYVTVYAHPQTADLVWDWKQVTMPSACSTLAVKRTVPHTLRREGSLALDSINVSWQAPLDSPLNGFLRHEIGHTQKVENARGGGVWTWQEIPSHENNARLVGLVPDSTYLVRVRAVSVSSTKGVEVETNHASDSIELRTGPLVGNYSQVYRISEYQFQPDFLDNHDAGDIDSIPIYVMDHNPITTASISPHWDQCEAALPKILPGMHGEGLPCLEYAAKHKRDEITAACGNFSTKDDFVGWDVHWYCGTGWPESVVMSSPMTEYCVHHLPAPTSEKYLSKDGFAAYLSCNGDEVDPWGNAPKKPMCICNVWMDRMISQEPKSRIQRMCGLKGENGTAYEPFVGNEVQCNCSGVNGNPADRDSRGGVFLEPADPSNSFVGRSPVVQPYLYYVRQDADFASHPFETYPKSFPSGFNYVFPRNGSCREDQPLGPPGGFELLRNGSLPSNGYYSGVMNDGIGDGCAWKRRPSSRVFWGNDLKAAGWNFTNVQDTPTDISHSLKNKALFKNMVSEGKPGASTASQFLSKRCCGC